ncbi:MAG: TonB-dependent receptor [Campylobacter sp.]|nr:MULTISPECIES: TonB-dependent receptor [Campylobacter]MDU6826838.1 TonB-dependent receptor [Campylobacter sp.]
MNKICKFSIICAAFLSLSNAAQNENEDLAFDTLEVSAKSVSNAEKSFATPGAVSSRDDIKSKTQSIDSIVRAMPGSYTQVDQSQGSVSVNIRGLTGLGRVNTMVDGVTQTYFGTSADSGGFHDFTGNLGTSAFGALIDQNFLVGIDIERGTFSGSNTGLMGSANFRTIGVDDVITEGKPFGFLGRYSYGSNKVGPSYMGAVAARHRFENGASLGFVFGYSGKKTSQNYTIGGGGKISDKHPDLNGDGVPDVPPSLDTDDLTQKPKSYLFKTEYAYEDSSAILSYRNLNNYLAKRKINNDSYQLNYRYDPNSDLVDVKFLAAYNRSKQNYDKGASISWGTLKNGMKFYNKSSQFDLSDTMKFNPAPELFITTSAGINLLTNKYTRQTGDSDYKSLTTNYAVPPGEQKVISYYLNNAFNYDIFEFDANFNLQKWRTKGRKGQCALSNPLCSQKEAGEFKTDDTYLNASLMASAKLHDLFSPFISYSRTSRPLNVQELFASGTVYEDINTALRPEKTQTWQIGFNSYKHGLFADDDVFGLKAVYYRSKVKDFIYDRLLMFDTPDMTMFLARLNDEAKFRGFELELTYDIGYFYTNLSYTRQKTTYLPSDSSALDWTNGPASGQSQFSELPKDYATLDIGTRLFGEKLTFGGLIKYTGKAKRIYPKAEFAPSPNNQNPLFKKLQTQELPKIPTVIDLYASYEPIKNLTLKFEVQNLTDKNYMDALYTYNSSYSSQVFNDDIVLFNNSARGRTFLMSFEYRY